MATVGDIIAVKGTQIRSIGPSQTVLDAANVMNEHKIGCLVVVDGGQLVGVISERDLLRRVIVERLDPVQTMVATVMTSEVVCCRTHTSIEEARMVMKNRRIRHLPVVDEARQLNGMISIGDLNAFDARSNEVTIHVLKEYIHGRS